VAIKFAGAFDVQRTPEEVYDFLTDPNKFAPLLPEFRGVSVEDAEHFTVKVNVGISYIKGIAAVKMHLSESDRPKRAQYKGQGSVAGGNVTMVAAFDLAVAGEGRENRGRSGRRSGHWIGGIIHGVQPPKGARDAARIGHPAGVLKNPTAIKRVGEPYKRRILNLHAGMDLIHGAIHIVVSDSQNDFGHVLADEDFTLPSSLVGAGHQPSPGSGIQTSARDQDGDDMI